jgi:hypothetical protein
LSSKITGASLIASGRVPNTTPMMGRVYMEKWSVAPRCEKMPAGIAGLYSSVGIYLLAR